MTPAQQLYQSRITTAEKAVTAIKSGMRVFMTGNCSVPQVLLAALVKRAPAFTTPVEIAQLFTIGSADYVAPGLERYLRVNTLFTGANVRQAVNEGRADYTPCFLSEVRGHCSATASCPSTRRWSTSARRTSTAFAAWASRSA